MSKSITSLSTLLTLMVLLTAATSTLAQVDQARTRPELAPAPTLGCCRCLGGTNTLDLSTVSSNSWIVNNNPVVFLAQIHPLWNINPGPAQWVSTVVTGGTGIIPKGTFDYSLKFVVPRCAIEQRVTLTGNFGGDDGVSLYLDNTTSAPIAQCTGGWCFNTPHKTLSTIPPTVVGPGTHTLIVRVENGGPSPSGMFVNAKLTGECVR